MKRPLLSSRIKFYVIVISLMIASLPFSTCEKFDDTPCPSCPCISKVLQNGALPGDIITIIGNNFDATADEITVTIDGYVATITEIISNEDVADSILVIVPPESHNGLIKIEVLNLSSTDEYVLNNPNCYQIDYILNPFVNVEVGRPKMLGNQDGDTSFALLYSPKLLSIDEDSNNSIILHFVSDKDGGNIRSLLTGHVLTINESTSEYGYVGLSDKVLNQRIYISERVVAATGYLKGNGHIVSQLENVPYSGFNEYSSSQHLPYGNMEINSAENALYFCEISSINNAVKIKKHIINSSPTTSTDIISISLPEDGIILPVDMELYANKLYLSYVNFDTLSSFSFTSSAIVAINVLTNELDTIYASNTIIIQFIAIDESGKLYASDKYNIYSIAQGEARWLGGGKGYYSGRLDECKFDDIGDIDFDKKNKLWIADSGNHIIRSAQY